MSVIEEVNSFIIYSSKFIYMRLRRRWQRLKPNVFSIWIEYEVVESLAVVYYNLYFIFLLHGNGISRLCTNSPYAVMREPQCLAPGEYLLYSPVVQRALWFYDACVLSRRTAYPLTYLCVREWIDSNVGCGLGAERIREKSTNYRERQQQFGKE